MTTKTPRGTSKSPASGAEPAATGAKAAKGLRARPTRPASPGQTTRGASTSPADGTEPAAPGSKAGEGRRYDAPQTLPALHGSALATPTARLILPAGAPEADWLAARQSGIGGSDVAAIVGLDRYRGALHVWLDKQGRPTFTDNEAAECGREMEPVILRLFSRRSGLAIGDGPGTLAHVDHDWMHANLDGVALEADGTPVPVEAKNRSEHQAKEWVDEVPDEPALQTHWYLAVTGYTHGYVAALIGGNRLRWHRVERDQELIDHLIDFCGSWWTRHVLEGVQPDVDGSRATTELLAHLWEVRPEAVAEVDPVTTAGLLHQRRELKAGIADLSEQLDLVENRLKDQLGPDEIAAVGGRTAYTWKANGTFRSTDFRTEQPELAARYVRQIDHVDLGRLAADHPEIHHQYRARRLYVPQEGPLS